MVKIFHYLFYGSHPNLVWVDPYQGDALPPALHDVLNLDRQIGNIVVGFLCISPELEAAYGEQFHLRMARGFQSVQLGADVKVPPQGGHVLPPSVSLFGKESIFSHSVISVKDRGVKLLGVSSRQIPGGDARQGHLEIPPSEQ